jgi:Rrf2 family transcriptional regulator, nitric oxide-sensitive transcriptional repressor
MFKINRKIEYALIALYHMKQKNSTALTTAKEICDSYMTPFDPTSRVLQIMTQHGILHAEQGVKGGYRIIRNLDLLTLKELSGMIAGPIRIANCFYDNSEELPCEISCKCRIMLPMTHLNERINHLFAGISVEELLNYQNPFEHMPDKHAPSLTASP